MRQSALTGRFAPIVTSRRNCDITTFLGNGDGTFGDPITATSSSHLLADYAIGDIDGDGNPDLS
ncbi:FG-GAP repeat domain-containing protein [Marinobacter sp.]|uniref:FG-GAP repeat domain-containing protein n=1 Tax=Marinobacter sp. TaxID=50741 RepID=UPI003A8FADB2